MYIFDRSYKCSDNQISLFDPDPTGGLEQKRILIEKTDQTKRPTKELGLRKKRRTSFVTSLVTLSPTSLMNTLLAH